MVLADRRSKGHHQEIKMLKLIVVSNRLPVKVRKKKSGMVFEKAVGGLASGLGSFRDAHKMHWIGWPGIARERSNRSERHHIISELAKKRMTPVFLTKKEVDDHYHGFCNKTIWPLFHYFTQYAEYERSFYDSYRSVNRSFMDALKEVYNKGDLIWVHDYHLMLLPRMIREELDDPNIGFFLHIPFPSYEVFRLFPWKKDLMNGLLGSDLIGFHTYDYVNHFLKSARRILGNEHELGMIECRSHYCKVDAFPMGIDFQRFTTASKSPSVKREQKIVRNSVGDRRIILSIDRLDYTKGILSRLESYDRFLETHPEFQEKVAMILIAVPSRAEVDRYEQLKCELDMKVGNVQGKYARIGWDPVSYINRFITYDRLMALYTSADICLVTPLRDGMNLIAKEYVASRNDEKGMLVLSEMAGSAQEMGEALIVNPNDHDEVANAIFVALTMSEDEMRDRNRSMRRRLMRYDIRKWGEDFIREMEVVKKHNKVALSKRLSPEIRDGIIDEFRKKDRRLILLDYDGTLLPLHPRPDQAGPDDEILGILGSLTSDIRNRVVIVSGRDRKTMDDWLGHLDLGICAEHGVWSREHGMDWTMLEPIDSPWKDTVRSLLEVYSDRTPGSILEEKDHSIAWHYRNSNPEIASLRTKELIGDLFELTTNQDVAILEGDKVIEVKSRGINKGRGVLRFLNEEQWKYIIALGDDVTDEDVFQVLPEGACSIKVGLKPSRARYSIDSVNEVRELLKCFVDAPKDNEKVL
ncbi:MAG: bifunctional alpha,alpha-trehalose-phosphate synthase (UDP-forming)/trehalose-phosphatase [Candidatus Thermoplasmatota archaeon]|nr:bifunctional alpha,alpha-trehalose-phosphate synthase (UDP-forming)/trehalose-phosphatase [Candidatus Thermoplasmatota archaeon]